jgi:hypothetical protein
MLPGTRGRFPATARDPRAAFRFLIRAAGTPGAAGLSGCRLRGVRSRAAAACRGGDRPGGDRPGGDRPGTGRNQHPGAHPDRAGGRCPGERQRLAARRDQSRDRRRPRYPKYPRYPGHDERGQLDISWVRPHMPPMPCMPRGLAPRRQYPLHPVSTALNEAPVTGGWRVACGPLGSGNARKGIPARVPSLVLEPSGPYRCLEAGVAPRKGRWGRGSLRAVRRC